MQLDPQRPQPLDETASVEQLEAAAAHIIHVAEAMATHPGVAATIITAAVELYAVNQEDAEGAIACQLSHLVGVLLRVSYDATVVHAASELQTRLDALVARRDS
jgi:hypothetical protein